MQKIFVCEDSIEGIFTGIYDAWASRHGHTDCRIQIEEIENYELFCEYITVIPDSKKAQSVSKTVLNRMGEEAYEDIYQSLHTTASDKGEAVYKTLVAGLAHKGRGSIMGHLSNPYVARVFELSRKAGNEVHHLLGFVRFAELQNGVLFSEIGPVNDVLTLMAPHFADRLPNENFMLYDKNRKSAIVHEKGKDWVYVTNSHIAEEQLRVYSEKEVYYQQLFQGFCHAISIESRENRALQRQMLPLRFQKFMVEFVKT